MALISRKKQVYPVRAPLSAYLRAYGRQVELPVRYEDLLRFGETTPVYDKKGRDTLWESVMYPPHERRPLYQSLVETYASLRVTGDSSLMRHLITDRVDLCSYGNTQPFRIRIVNTLNDNFDYFYVKRADASRVYGLELEHLLSPNHIEYFYDEETLIEEHISGIPGDLFMKHYLEHSALDEVRLAKEFVKFNERCFIRLLGDMHAGNFVVVILQDFDETQYRIRPIDFDQQSYEGRAHVYLPQYYKQNNPIIFLGVKCMSDKTVRQYQEEERTLTRNRARNERVRLRELLRVMSEDVIAPRSNVQQLAAELAEHYEDAAFLGCSSMGALVRTSLSQLGWDD